MAKRGWRCRVEHKGELVEEVEFPTKAECVEFAQRQEEDYESTFPDDDWTVSVAPPGKGFYVFAQSLAGACVQCGDEAMFRVEARTGTGAVAWSEDLCIDCVEGVVEGFLGSAEADMHLRIYA